MLSNSRKLPVPDGWEDTTIGQVADVVGGSTPSTSNPEYWNGGVPWATPTDITALEGRYIAKTQTTISELGLKNSGASLIPARSVLMTSRATIGACAINTVSMATNQGFASLIPKNGINTEFLYYLLTTRTNELRQLAAGSTFVELGREQLRKLHLLRPPETQQAKIVKILNSVDDAIEATRAVIEQTRRLKTALLQDLLTNGLSGRHHRFINVKRLGRIPAGWGVVPLDDLVNQERPICYGILMPGRGHPGGIPVVKVKDIEGGKIKLANLLLTSPELDEEYQRSRLKAKDLLLTIRGTTGRVAIVPAELEDANITQDTARIAVKDTALRAYLYYALQGQSLQQQIQHHTIGQAVKGINIEEVRRLLIPLPQEEEQQAIANCLRQVDRRIEVESNLLEQLVQSKTALSQGLLTGCILVRG